MSISVIIPNNKVMQDSENKLERRALEYESKDGFINIIQFALDLDIKIYQVNDENENFNAEIQYFPDTDLFEILVNGTHSTNRQRFSIGHETSHFLKHKNVLMERKKLHRIGYCNNHIDSEMEKEADLLAEKLLMPRKLLEDHFLSSLDRKKQISLITLQKIAKHFRVSLIVAKIRLENLGWKVPYISYSYSA